MLLSILFDVHAPPEDLIEAVSLFVTVGALYWLIPPSFPSIFYNAGTVAPAMVKEFLYLHCNAAKPGLSIFGFRLVLRQHIYMCVYIDIYRNALLPLHLLQRPHGRASEGQGVPLPTLQRRKARFVDFCFRLVLR